MLSNVNLHPLQHGDHENELLEEDPFTVESLPGEERALLDSLKWADEPLGEALAFHARHLPPPYIAFHWRSERVLGWVSADITRHCHSCQCATFAFNHHNTRVATLGSPLDTARQVVV